MIKWLLKEGTKVRHGAGEFSKPEKGVMWIYAVSPTDKEIKIINKRFKIPTSRLRNYIHRKRSVRYSFKPFSFTFVDYCLAGEVAEKRNILYSIGSNFIVTVLEKPIKSYEQTYLRMTKEIKKVPGVMSLMTEILNEDIEENYDVLENVENKITELEKDIALQRNARIAEIVNLRRVLNNMSKAFWGSSRLTFIFKKGLTPVDLSDSEKNMMDDLHDAFMYQIDIISNLKEMLTDTITIYQTNISNRLADISNKINTSIKKLTYLTLLLTGAALVISIPNTAATFFGIPFLSGPQVWYITAAVIITLLISIVWFYFYWKKIRAD